MEFMSKGSLKQLLTDNSSDLDQKNLISFCSNSASGMLYLSSKGIIHRDLACRNLLVTKEENYIVKIADFGLSTVLDTKTYYTSQAKEKQLPVKWSAPEVLNYQKFSFQSDVWSFGVVIWEIFSYGKTPYPAFNNIETMEEVGKGYRMSMPENCPEPIAELTKKCWDIEPANRPSFQQICDSLSILTGNSSKSQLFNSTKKGTGSSYSLSSPKVGGEEEILYQSSPNIEVTRKSTKQDVVYNTTDELKK